MLMASTVRVAMSTPPAAGLGRPGGGAAAPGASQGGAVAGRVDESLQSVLLDLWTDVVATATTDGNDGRQAA